MSEGLIEKNEDQMIKIKDQDKYIQIKRSRYTLKHQDQKRQIKISDRII